MKLNAQNDPRAAIPTEKLTQCKFFLNYIIVTKTRLVLGSYSARLKFLNSKKKWPGQGRVLVNKFYF